MLTEVLAQSRPMDLTWQMRAAGSTVVGSNLGAQHEVTSLECLLASLESLTSLSHQVRVPIVILVQVEQLRQRNAKYLIRSDQAVNK